MSHFKKWSLRVLATDDLNGFRKWELLSQSSTCPETACESDRLEPLVLRKKKEEEKHLTFLEQQ